MGDLRLRRLRDHLRGRGAAREDRRDPRAAAEPAHDHRDRPARRCRQRLASGTSNGAVANGSAQLLALGAIPLERRCASAGARGRANGRGARSAPRRRRARGSVHVHLHVRHHRAAQGLRAHPRQLPRDHRHGRRGSARSPSDEVTYLYLPLAHSYALLVQLAAFDLGSTLAYFGGDTKQIMPELMEVKPTYLPSVPRVFEKIYTRRPGRDRGAVARGAESARSEAISLGVKVRDMMNRGEAVPEEHAEAVRRGRRAAVQERARALRRARAPRDQRRRARSPTRSSSSSTPAACRCSRATA